MTTSTPKKKNAGFNDPPNSSIAFENDETLTNNEQETAYKTALEQSYGFDAGYKDYMATEKSYHAIEVNRVHEVEKLRQQLQSMVNPVKSFEGYSLDDFNNSSSSSIDTMTLLNSNAPYTSPELQMDENGVLFSSLNDNMVLKPSFDTSLMLDSSLVAENKILKDIVEKERLRRKHCEEQIHELQDKLLECQEQLAIAVSTEKKKVIMINQLDKTLANVVDGWKQQESAKENLIAKLKQEKDSLEMSHKSHQQILETFEHDLSEAVRAFEEEQEKLRNMEMQHRTYLGQVAEEKIALKKQIEELQNANHSLEVERDTNLKMKDALIAETESLLKAKTSILQDFEQKSIEWNSAKVLLEEKLIQAEREYIDRIKDLQLTLDTVQNEIEELQYNLSTKDQENYDMKMELHTLNKEKETQAMELTLLQSKFEALKTKQDSETRTKLEGEFNVQILEIQKQIASTEHELRQSQKKKMSELMQIHKDELEEQKQRFQQDIKIKDELLARNMIEYEHELKKANHEIAELTAAGKLWNSQRGELMNRIKYIMQQHWQETISLLNNDEKFLLYPEHVSGQLSSTACSEIPQEEMQPSNVAAYMSMKMPNDTDTSKYVCVNGGSRPMIVPTKSDPLMLSQNLYNIVPVPRDGQRHSDSILAMKGNFTQDAWSSSIHHSSIPQTDSGVENENIVYEQLQQNVPINSELLYDKHKNSNPFSDNRPSEPADISSNHSRYWVHKLYKASKLERDSYAQSSYPSPSRSTVKTTNIIKHQNLRKKDCFLKQQAILDSYSDKNDPVSLLYQDIDDSDNDDMTQQSVRHQNTEQDEKRSKLTHFIEKLLQRSPGQPLVGENYETDVKQSAIAKDGNHTLQHTPQFGKKQNLKNPAVKSLESESVKQNSGRTVNKEYSSVMQDQYIKKSDELLQFTEQTNRTANDKPNKLYGGHCRRPTKSSEAKQSRRRVSKDSNLNKNIASKEHRRVLKDKQAVGNTNTAWK